MHAVDDLSNMLMVLRMSCPKLLTSIERHLEKIAGIKVAFYQRVVFQVIESNWNQEFQAKPLADHDAKILDRELVERLPMELVTRLDQVTGIRGQPPIIVLKFLE